jgi:hypothetical protein
MRRIALFLLVAGLALGAPTAAAAQQQGPPQMMFVVQDFVKPGMIQDYEMAGKSFLKDLAATPNAKETIRYTALSGLETGYIYVVPVSSWADLGNAFQNWDAAGKAMGQEKWAAHMSRSAGMLDRSATSMIVLRPDLSYLPETTVLTVSTDRPYRHYNWWYVIPGKEQAIEAVAKEYVELYRSKGIETGWLVYKGIVGPDAPMYLVVQTASDPAAFHAEQQHTEQMLGEAGQRLAAKARQFARRIEENDAWIRPDLSFPMMEQQVGSR